MKVKGTCYLVVAFDVGFAIDLRKAESRLGARERVALKDKRRAPVAVQLQQQPVRTTQSAQPFSLGSWNSGDSVDVVLYDFGAIAVTYHVRLEDTLERWVELSSLRYDNEKIIADAREQTARIMTVIGDALQQAHSMEIVEDYGVFELASLRGPDVTHILADHGPTLAQILRGEMKPLSSQEVADALDRRFSYGAADLCLVDWSAAVLIGEDMIDERAVLEFVTVEAAELRSLDAQLDNALNEAYDLVNPGHRWLDLPFGSMRKDMERLARLQVDNAFLFETVTNAQKLLGDQYLAELYHAAFERYHLGEWSAAIDRKLNIIESLYEKLSDQTSSRRLEALEWIVIILIALELVVLFLPVTH